MVDTEQGIKAAESITQVCSMLCEKHREGRKWDRTADELFDSICKVLEPSDSQRAARNKALLNLSLLLEGQEMEFQAADWLVSADCHFQLYGSCRMGTDLGASDLDLTVHASLTMRSATNARQEPKMLLLCELHPEQKAALGKKLLHAMADIIEDSGAVRGGRVLRILGKKTRVPLLRFEETETGVVCDVSCTNEGPVFKSAMLRNVLEIDERAVHLVRLVKQWARLHSINDGSQGTFNSYALTNMAIHHLQAQTPPVIPPLAVLMPPDLLATPEDAPRAAGSGGFQFSEPGMIFPRDDPPQSVIEDASESTGSIQARCATLTKQGYGKENTASMAELFASFIVRFMVVTRAWSRESGDGVAVSSYEGKLVCADDSLHSYAMIVEDPFNSKVNVTRSVRGNYGRGQGFSRTAVKIGNAFEQTSKALADMKSAQSSQSTTYDMITSMFGSSIAADVFGDVVDDNEPSPGNDATRGRGKGGKGAGSAGQQRKKQDSGNVSPELAAAAGSAGKQDARKRGQDSGSRKGAVARASRERRLSATPAGSPVWSVSSLLHTGRALHVATSSFHDYSVYSVPCPCVHHSCEDAKPVLILAELKDAQPIVSQRCGRSYVPTGVRTRVIRKQWACQSVSAVKRVLRM